MGGEPAGRFGIRRAGVSDLGFLWEMLAVAVSWRQPEPVPVAEVEADDVFARYLSGWGRGGDLGLVAVRLDEPLGAAWGRLFTAAEHGYGFLDKGVPEISIGVRRQARGRGIGSALLEALAAEARRAGFAALSLSVERENPAVRLYERAGYRIVGSSDDEDWVMRLDLG
jgi:GNAT superfamily N-acetyltransferase